MHYISRLNCLHYQKAHPIWRYIGSKSTSFYNIQRFYYGQDSKDTRESIKSDSVHQKIICDNQSLTESLTVQSLNKALKLYPIECVASLFVLEIVSFGGCFYTLKLLNVKIPPLFAVAYALSVPIRKSGLPKLFISLPIAYGLNSLFPSISKVKLSYITESTPYVSLNQVISQYVPFRPKSYENWNNRKSGKWKLILKQKSDKFGFSIFIAYRMAGALIVIIVYSCLQLGMDVSLIDQYLAGWGYKPFLSNNNTIGPLAAAAVIGSLLFPVSILICPKFAKLLNNIRHSVFSQLKKLKK